jgi:uncharacterized membrane protein
VRSVWWLRWVIVVIAALIGIVLISSHHVLLGILFVAMAIARIALLLTVRKRRAAFREGRRGRLGPPS